MELENIPIAVIVIGMAAIAMVGFMGGFSANYPNATIDTSFADSYNKINLESGKINNMSDTLFSSGASTSFSWIPTIGSILGIGSIIKSSVGIINLMLQDLTDYIGIPAPIIAGIVAILTIGFVFAVLRLTIGRSRI